MKFLRSILAGGAIMAAPGMSRAVWASTGAGRGTLKLVFYSDVHARVEWDTPDALAMAAEHMNAQKADLLIGGGDLITDGFQSSAATARPRWDAYMTMHNALRGELHTAIGNHDLVAAIPEDGTEPATDPRSVFRERIGVPRTYYSFDALGYHFVVLDSIQILGQKMNYQGMIGPEQMDWLRQDLGRTPKDQPIVVVLHIPLLTTFYQATKGATAAAPPGRVVVNNLDVLDAFTDHNLALVLQGHLHVSERMQWRNTTFITGEQSADDGGVDPGMARPKGSMSLRCATAGSNGNTWPTAGRRAALAMNDAGIWHSRVSSRTTHLNAFWKSTGP